MNNWVKKGKIFSNIKSDWSETHAALPTPFILKNGDIRIFYTTRDVKQCSRISFIDLDSEFRIKEINKKPIFNLGEIGSFDDLGCTSSQVLKVKENYFFFYNGYNTATTVRYRIGIGLAFTDDNLTNFKKYSDGPIMDRSVHSPCGAATPFIIFEDNLYKMWYASFEKWKEINGIKEPFYCIKYAESKDAINWYTKPKPCIFLNDDEGGIVRPSIIKMNGLYHMWYSVRKNTNYREQKDKSYRIGYATSLNGLEWERKDDEVKIELSKSNWDSQMLAYPYVFILNSKLIMLYNGNGFGQSGFGYAEQNI